MRIWKFVIPYGDYRPDGQGNIWSGVGAAAVASSVEEARAALTRYGVANGLRTGWLYVADVTEIPLDNGAVALWTEI